MSNIVEGLREWANECAVASAHSVADRAREAANEIERLEKLVYVPGVLKCSKCGFGLIKTTLHVQTGNFSANNEPDHCPNDGAPLWRVTERDAGNDLVDRGAEMSDQIIRLRATLQDIADLDKHGGYNTACHRARAALQQKP